MGVQISIIIPCYNSEVTLENTLLSVVEQDWEDWEVVIVNDGSTDTTEEIALKWVNRDTRFRYFSKKNEGLGKARNYGIERAKGIFILPLDSDNLVEKSFCSAALQVFKSNNKISVVHGHAEFIGEKNGIWNIKSFDLESIMIDNYIDACAIFRKSIWAEVGGYDENMPFQGFEDWEFWLAIGSRNYCFHHLDTVTFKYFVSNCSMIRSFTNPMEIANRDYIVKKYSKLYYDLLFSKSRLLEQNRLNLTSRKYVLNIFFRMFFGFELFKSKFSNSKKK